MKRIITALLVALPALLFTACNNNKTTTADTSTTSINSDSANATDNMATNNSMTDTGMSHTTVNNTVTPDLSGAAGAATFTTEAANGGMMEVEAAKVAQKNATSKDVKELATMILNDHTKANNELKRIASGKNIMVPTSMPAKHQSHIDMLSSKTGAEFDRMYVDMMESDHSKDIEMFTKASSVLSDNELKAFAAKTVPVLKKHAAKVKAVQAKM